jgi:hypothetical protein
MSKHIRADFWSVKMKRIAIPAVAGIAILLVAACGGPAPTGSAQAANAVQAAAPAASGSLNESYTDALPVATQLILGSLKLDDGDQAITKDEAATLLPLWQAYQNLSVSDSTAPAELTALVNQIQKAMQPGQVEAIAAMQLTANDVGDILQAQGPGLFGGGADNRGNGAAAGGGFQRPAGGFIPGEGGPGGGGPGGGTGGNFQQLSPSERSTAVAQRAARGGDFMSRGLVNALITSLKLKTGELTQAQLQAEQAQRAAMRWVPTASEATGIAVDKLNAAMSEGKTLAEAIQAEGGDVSKAEAAIRERLQNAPNADAQALDAEVTAALNTKAPAQPSAPQQ